MKKVLLLAAIAMAVSGCATVKVATTTVDVVTLQKAAYTARAGYVAAMTVAAEVTDLPRCEKAPMPCVWQKTVNEIRNAATVADAATKNAEDMARNKTADPMVLALVVEASQKSVDVFKLGVET